MRQNSFLNDRNIILIVALAALFIPVIAIEYNVMKSTNGTFMYPLDDTFIHMSVAKNFAFYNNWGINKSEFASASSSLFYTLLLAALFKIFSAQIIIPFIVNVVAAIGLLIVLQRWLQKQNIPATAQLIILLCIIFFTPLPILIISGMEHILQCIFSFLFIFKFSEWLEKMLVNKEVKWRLPWQIFLYGILVSSIRYEGIFLIGIICLILLFYKKIVLAFQLGIISLLPIIIFGIYSVTKGSYFLPNSVLLKSQSIPFSLNGIVEFFGNIFIQKLTTANTGITLLATQRLLIILPLAYLFFIKQIQQKISYKFILIILIGCTFLQLSFASTGWFYRYEAYLILCSIMILSVLIYNYLKDFFLERTKKMQLIVLVALLFMLSFPFVLRSMAAFSKASQACVNIYQQQYQMGQFQKKYYDNYNICANDIGALTFFTNANDLDLWGLGNIDVARSKKNNYWTANFLDSLSKNKNAGIAIVYDSWFSDSLLNRWKKVATWQMQNNVICGSDIVSFYAIDKNIEPDLKKNLIDFQKILPADVKVKYY
ncbi:MAG: hypothetical protein ACR2FN_11105 [Chitinophagaceae bacterium]